MSNTEPKFTIGVEEEYLLVDRESRGLIIDPPASLMKECEERCGSQVTAELLRSQIEIGTKVCRNVQEAREDLTRLRKIIIEVANSHGLAPIAASTHPFSSWVDQKQTPKDRYEELTIEMQAAARRLLICGMHVHVGIADKDLRIDLMNQLSYFLPHLLAMSGSSPFWCGDDTGLNSYRLTIFDNLPRTGLPPKLDGWGSFDRSVDTLIELGTIEDSSKIWWDLRPSSKFPTLETRICDASPRMETTLSLAATIQCLLRMLWRLSRNNQRWRIYENFLLAENRWRAQRYGISEGLIDFGRREIVPFKELLDELIDQLITEDAEALGSVNEVAALRNILENGTSADQQRTVFNSAVAAGASKDIALCAVVHHLIEEFKADL